MEDQSIHELTAGFALDALDDSERRAYEEHLRTCPRCREELGRLSEAAGELAHGAPPATPPDHLRERILEAYYAVSLAKPVTLTLDYQFVQNPAYNADRGPVSIFAARLHTEF